MWFNISALQDVLQFEPRRRNHTNYKLSRQKHAKNLVVSIVFPTFAKGIKKTSRIWHK